MDTMDPLQTAQRHAGDCRTILKIKTLEDWNNWPTDDVSRKNNKNNEKTLTEQIHDMTCKGKHQHCKYEILPEYEISFRFGGKFHFNLELFFTQVFAIAEDAAGWFLNCRYQSGLEWSRLKEGAASQSGSGRPTGNISTRSPHLLFFFFRRLNISVTISGGSWRGDSGLQQRRGRPWWARSSFPHPCFPPIWRLAVAAL